MPLLRPILLSLLISLPLAALAAPSGDVPNAAEVGADGGVRDWQGTSFQSGGDGAESRMVLDRRLRQFNLRVLMSEGPRSAYVSGASLRIVGPDGRDRLKADDVGPYVDVKLPAGRYTMTAVFEGRTREAAVQVRAEGLARVHLHWADERADRDGGSRP